MMFPDRTTATRGLAPDYPTDVWVTSLAPRDLLQVTVADGAEADDQPGGARNAEFAASDG